MIFNNNWIEWNENNKLEGWKNYLVQLFSWELSPKKLAKASVIFEKILQKNPQLLTHIQEDKAQINNEVDKIIEDLKKSA